MRWRSFSGDAVAFANCSPASDQESVTVDRSGVHKLITNVEGVSTPPEKTQAFFEELVELDCQFMAIEVVRLPPVACISGRNRGKLLAMQAASFSVGALADTGQPENNGQARYSFAIGSSARGLGPQVATISRVSAKSTWPTSSSPSLSCLRTT